MRLAPVFVSLLAVWMGFRVEYPATADGGSVARLIAQRALGAGAWTAASIYSKPLATAPPPGSRPPGAIDSVWISVSEDGSYWRKGGWRLRVGAVTAAGDSGGWSNWAIVAAGVKDTLYADVGAGGLAIRYPSPNPFRPSILEVRWIHAEGDTLPVPLEGYFAGRGPILHYEEVALALRCPICGIYPYVARRGIRDSTLCRMQTVCP